MPLIKNPLGCGPNTQADEEEIIVGYLSKKHPIGLIVYPDKEGR